MAVISFCRTSQLVTQLMVRNIVRCRLSPLSATFIDFIEFLLRNKNTHLVSHPRFELMQCVLEMISAAQLRLEVVL